jgi:hypothetical protein
MGENLQKRRDLQEARGFAPFVKATANSYLRQIGAAKRT